MEVGVDFVDEDDAAAGDEQFALGITGGQVINAVMVDQVAQHVSEQR